MEEKGRGIQVDYLMSDEVLDDRQDRTMCENDWIGL
jgi:hypothetical protein